MSDIQEVAANAVGSVNEVMETGTRKRRPSDPAEREARANAKALIMAELENNSKLKKSFVEAIKLLVSFSVPKPPMYVEVVKFLKEQGEPTDDFTIYKNFKLAETQMRGIIYSAQEAGIWVSAVKDGDDVMYNYIGESENQPEGYPGPIKKRRVHNNANNDPANAPQHEAEDY